MQLNNKQTKIGSPFILTFLLLGLSACDGGSVGGGIPTSDAGTPDGGDLCDLECENGGNCVESDPDGLSCDCPAGFTGDNCERVLGGCDDDPCENGGTCTEADGSFVCACVGDFTGPTCSDVAGPCDDNPCQNGGACSPAGDGFLCDCPAGFTGDHCERVIGGCDDDPCENGGTCSEAGGSFVCVCVGDFTGPTCSDVLGPCDNDPCQNGGICSPGGNIFSCECTIDFTGPTCSDPRPVGLEGRPGNTDCVAPTRVVSSGPIEWQPNDWGGAPGLNLMMMRQLPDGTWIEIYREGSVYAVDSAQQRTGPLLTINVSTDGEMGLLGLAVHPDWPTAPYLYFYYTTLPGNGHIHIDRYTANPSGATPTIDAGSRTEIFDFDRGVPWTNHVAGTIEFDPNASTPMLYAAMGDAENQPEAQNPASYYGALLRFDVESPPYTPEVVGIGLRNPFRWSFDSQTGDLWIGDVGDAAWEEVNRVLAADIPGPGGTPINFGWPIMEGFECRTGSDPANSCGHSSPLRLPIHAYDHGVGLSVIGGRVYRGQAIAGFGGTYVFNDIFVQNGEGSWTLRPNPNQDPSVIDDDYTRAVIPGGGGGFVAFAEDNQGELYGLTTWGGISKLGAASGGEPQDPLPVALSDTGCFDAGGAAAAGLVPYDLRAPLWSDAATKRRWLALPDNARATLDARGDLAFPNGTVLAKEFTLDGVRVETRLFMRHPDGVWAGYSYAWVADDGSPLADGELLPNAVVTRMVPGTGKTWTYPSRGQCLTCHTEQAGWSLGIEAGHLNTDYTYAATGTTANQLYTLSAIGMVVGDIARFGDRAYPAYDDDAASLDDRVWSYLNSNCAGCHQPGATGMSGRSQMPDLRYDLLHDTQPGETHPLVASLCNVDSGSGDIGLGPNAPLVVPGTPGDWTDTGAGGSVLYLRMAARPNVPGSTGTMPQLGSAEVDEVHGLPLMSAWITDLVCD